MPCFARPEIKLPDSSAIATLPPCAEVSHDQATVSKWLMANGFPAVGSRRNVPDGETDARQCNRFLWDDSAKHYRLRYGDEQFVFAKPGKGFPMIYLLLRNKNRPVCAEVLYNSATLFADVRSAAHPHDLGPAGADEALSNLSNGLQLVMDDEALRRYKRYCEHSQRTLASNDSNDHEHASTLDSSGGRQHRDVRFVKKEISRAVAPHGRFRPIAASDSEKNRQRVKKALQRAIKMIRQQMPQCAEHFSQSIPRAIGGGYTYRPRESCTWDLRGFGSLSD